MISQFYFPGEEPKHAEPHKSYTGIIIFVLFLLALTGCFVIYIVSDDKKTLPALEANNDKKDEHQLPNPKTDVNNG